MSDERLRVKFSHPYLSKLYMEWENEDLHLESTKLSMAVWCDMLLRPKLHSYLWKIEEIITLDVLREWGPETVIEFNREHKMILIVNAKDKRTCILHGDNDGENIRVEAPPGGGAA